MVYVLYTRYQVRYMIKTCRRADKNACLVYVYETDTVRIVRLALLLSFFLTAQRTPLALGPLVLAPTYLASQELPLTWTLCPFFYCLITCRRAILLLFRRAFFPIFWFSFLSSLFCFFFFSLIMISDFLSFLSVFFAFFFCLVFQFWLSFDYVCT